MTMFNTDCRFFSGYRPCRFGRACSGCPEYAPSEPDILLINLDALGDVLRTTALLPAIRRRHPNARITWLTRPRALPLLQGNPLIDHLLTLGYESDVILRSRRFDLILNADKSMVAGALAMQIDAGERRGFGIDKWGAIVPLNSAAEHLYRLGLDNDAKFRQNQRTEPDLLAEALGFEHQGDEYCLSLDGPTRGVTRSVGFNTGCSPQYPNKKLDLELQATAISRISAELNEPVLLLGGPEDAADHARLGEWLGEHVEHTPTSDGLRAGAEHVDRCEVVFSGDSLGMHMAIALRKHVVAWFGVTCPQEIELYKRGIKLLADVDCAPCWKGHCEKSFRCSHSLTPERIERAVLDCLRARQSGVALDEVRGVWA